LAVHPAEHPSQELYLMCDDLAATIEKLSGAGASFGPVNQERWGRIALMTIPGGAQLSIYEPSHRDREGSHLGSANGTQPVRWSSSVSSTRRPRETSAPPGVRRTTRSAVLTCRRFG
jgi:hypothetical protein